MKKTTNKIIDLIQKIIILIVNMLFTKIKDKIPDDLWAKFYWPNDKDERDFRVEDVLKKPTKEELKKLPEKIDLLQTSTPNFLPTNQGCVPSCTASSLSNYIWIQIAKLEDKNISTQKWAEILRTDMGHKWKCEGEGGDYLENALKTVNHNWLFVSIYNNWISEKYYNIKWYAYTKTNKENIKYWISKWHLLYFAIRWNKQTWREILSWEIKTFNFQDTWWHAITITWYDKNYLYFINTWKPNDWDKYKWDYSIFKITWDWLDEMIKNWLANWRLWIIYLNNNTTMFKDFEIQKNEQGEAVKMLTEKWIVKWVPHNDWIYLEPWRAITRIEVFILLYRILKFLWK